MTKTDHIFYLPGTDKEVEEAKVHDWSMENSIQLGTLEIAAISGAIPAAALIRYAQPPNSAHSDRGLISARAAAYPSH
jgi:hypothetical protein